MEPEVTLAGTSKERILCDILELFHQLGTSYFDFDHSNICRASDLIEAGKAYSAFAFLSKFMIGNCEGRKDFLCSIIRSIDSTANAAIISAKEQVSGSNIIPNQMSQDPATTSATATTADLQNRSSNINWCLSESAPLSDKVGEWSELLLQNRKGKKSVKQIHEKS
jgi:hypothetical protein